MSPTSFRGRIGRTVADSEPWFDEPAHPADGAPNVIVVLLDDTRLRASSVATAPTSTRRTSTALAGERSAVHQLPRHPAVLAHACRAADRHATTTPSACGTVANFDTGFPNQLGHISDHAATVAEVLRRRGLRHVRVGKWHLAPMRAVLGRRARSTSGRSAAASTGSTASSTARPTSSTPSSSPTTTRSTRPAAPRTATTCREDLVDQASRMIADFTGRATRPAVLRATSRSARRTHRTRRRPSTWRSTAAASTRAGTSCASAGSRRQLELGVIPPDTELAPRNPGVKPWDDAVGQRAAPRLLGCRRRSPRSSTTPTSRSAGSSTGCGGSGSSTTRCSCCCPTTARRRRAARSG